MEESEDNMSAEEIKFDDGHIKNKPKKRSLVERELETNLTARVTSPLTNRDTTSTSRYGRARRLKSDAEFCDTDKNVSKLPKSAKLDKSPSKMQSPAYKMHASNSPIRVDTPKRDVTLENQIEDIYSENVSLSRFSSEEKAKSSTKKAPKVYIRKDLIQSKDKEDDTVVLIKNMFSPSKSGKKTNYSERSSEKYNLKKPSKGYPNTSSVVKTLDFDGKKKKREEKKMVLSKSELFDLEAQCEYQVGDLAWARMGTYPFWPCIITRDPLSGMFVKKKLFGRIERDVLHVTFFGDNGRRGWIVGTMLRKFLGQLEFEEARTNFTPEAKKKDPRLYAAFLISDKKMPQWQLSVEEAEMLLREPKRLRIDLLYDMLQKSRETKTTPKLEKRKKIVRTNSDVSLSESLLDTLFSEDDSKGKDIERSRSKSRNRSLDVSDVVTACLDNMAAKTGITTIQRQSHMDRWLQKAKSKTPEKSHLQSHLSLKMEKDNKVSNTAKFKKNLPKKSCLPNNFRKTMTESQYETENRLFSHQNEHNYSLRYRESNGSVILDDVEIEYENAEMFTSDVEPGSGLGIISKVETLCGNKQHSNNQSDVIMTVPNNQIIISDAKDTENQVGIQNYHGPSLALENELVLRNESDEPSLSINESEIMGINNNIDLMKLKISETMETTNAEKDKNCVETLSTGDNSMDSNIVTFEVSDQNILDITNRDNKCMDICKSHKQTEKSDIYDNVPVTVNTIVSEAIMADQNDSKSNMQGNDCMVEQKKHVYQVVCVSSLPPDCTSNSLDKNILYQTTLQKENVLKENLSQKKGLESNNCNENNSPLELKNSTGHSKNNLITQSLELSNVLQELADDGIEDFPDISTKVGDKTIKLHTARNNETVTKKKVPLNKKERTENEMSNSSTKSLNVSNLVNSTKYTKDGIVDISDISASVGEKNYMTKLMSLHQTELKQSCLSDKRQNDLKEFEAQLYNIFGLINKKSPKSRLSLSRNTTNLTDEINTTSNTVQINSNDETECVESVGHENECNGISAENKNTNAAVRLEVGPLKREIFTQIKQSYNKCTDINISKKNNLNNKEDLSQLATENIENHCNKNEVILRRNSIDIFDADTNSTDDNEESLAAFQLKLKSARNSIIESDTARESTVIGNNSEVSKTNKDNNERKENIAVNSEDSETSPQNIKQFDHKLNYALKNPDFLKYLELKQDVLIDEQPELTEVEVTNYLYKTWLYEESLKSDIKKNDDIQNARLVNGQKQSPIKIKLSLNKSSKNSKKTYKVQITNDNDTYQSPPVVSTLDNTQIKTDFKGTDLNKNDNYVNRERDSSPKRSKRKKRNSPYSTRLEKYFNKSVKIDNYCDRVPKLTPKESRVKGSGTCEIVNEIKANMDDVTCKDFATVSSKSSVQNGYNTDQTTKQLHSYNKIDCIEKLAPEVSEPVTQNGCYEGKLKSGITSLDNFDVDSNSVGVNDEETVARQLLLTSSKNQSAYVADGEINMKNTMDVKEEKYEPEKDDTDISIKSEDSEISISNKKIHTHLFSDTKKALKNSDFLKYVELKQDTLIDEHPELTEGEITNYLYKTWLYEESLKNDIKKADDIETVTNLVKGLNQDSVPVKRVRKKKVEKDKQVDFNLDCEDTTRKQKSKRKIIKQYFYKEHFSDIEDDIEFFEICKQSETPTPVNGSPGTITIETSGTEVLSSNFQTTDEFVMDEIDQVEEYFRQLTEPKPNLFKGLLREKVCEICETVDNLIKCKGCYCMFHVDCVKKKAEVVEVASTINRGRKKKKKNRGRKAKDHANNLDSEDQSDEKSQDANASDEMLNTSIDNEIEPYVIANADDFEAQLSVKMKELLENPENNKDDSFSSAEELDWDDIDYGECKIVDILPRKKDRGYDIDYSNFKCNNCQKYQSPVCFVCKSAVSPKDKVEHRQRCQVAHCQKYYHLECLDHWPQTQFNAGELSRINNSNQLVEALSCPRHVCHTCVCDDPRGCKTRFSGDKLARCVRCPATYHTFTKCLPAGSQILTASHIICPRHYEHRPGTQPRHVNTGWCFICALGGTLICCEYCPTSFHAECLNIDPPEGGYMCEDCETGRLPLYGEMVWVKLGHYRWWPGIILHPSEIPLNILAVKHSQGEFVVRFFGQYDYYWVNRGRVFPFQEGDSGRISGQKSKIDAAFIMAMEHAQRACAILKTASPNKEESMDIASSLLPPHYVKLKVNKPCGSLCGKKIDIEESSLTQCECDPNESDPCGPYTQCLNRMLLTECGPTCRAGDRCNNRAFEKRLYPKMTPYRTPHSRGWGLKTLEDIKAGQFVIEYVGELIDEEEFKRRMRRKHEVRDENFYYLTLDKERMIDAGPKGNLARFMNHSCEPNCETQKWTVLGDVRVGLFAIYDIPANSELTFNYNLESTGIEKKQCMCGAKRCSGYIGEKPKQDDQPKKPKPALQAKRTYKKRKNVDLSPSTKPKQRVGRPYKPRELTEIEKDLLIIKNATNGMSSDSESSSRYSIDSKDSKGLKRRRIEDSLSPSTKKFKTEKPVEVIQETDKYQDDLTNNIAN